MIDRSEGGEWLYTNRPSREWVKIPARYQRDFNAWLKLWRRRAYMSSFADSIPPPEEVSDWLMWRMSVDTGLP